MLVSKAPFNSLDNSNSSTSKTVVAINPICYSVYRDDWLFTFGQNASQHYTGQ